MQDLKHSALPECLCTSTLSTRCSPWRGPFTRSSLRPSRDGDALNNGHNFRFLTSVMYVPSAGQRADGRLMRPGAAFWVTDLLGQKACSQMKL